MSNTNNEEFEVDLITLIDDEGKEHEFEILDVIENDDGCFYALLPTFEDPAASIESEGTYYIFEAIEEDGEEQLAEVENDIKEILRVLKPGGKVFIASNVQTEALSEEQQSEIEMLHMHIVSSEAFKKLMKDAGYCNVKVYEQDAGRQVCAVGMKPM